MFETLKSAIPETQRGDGLKKGRPVTGLTHAQARLDKKNA
jgi:hypothetical protein